MQIDQLALPLSKALTINAGQSASNSSCWQANIFDLIGSDPTGDGVYPVNANDDKTGVSPLGICVLPYAEGYAGGEFWMTIYGWRRLGRESTAKVWMPVILAQVACVLCDKPGLAGLLDSPRLINDTERFCGWISLTDGAAAVYTSANQTVGYILVPLQGCQVFQFDFFIGDELPAFPNALWAKM